MPRDGTGTFTRIYNWVNDRNANIKITASRMDGDSDDIAAALTDSVAADGQTTMSGHLKMGTNRVTGVGNGIARTDVPSIGQIQDSNIRYAVTGGSSNAYTLDPQPPIATLVAGISLLAKVSFTCTGASTLNLSGLGDKSIKKNVSQDVAAGDLFIDQMIEFFYDGTNFQLPGALGGGGGYNPGVGSYVVGGNTENIDISSNGTIFTGSDPVFTGTPNIIAIESNGTNYVCLANLTGSSGANVRYSSDNGASWQTPSGNVSLSVAPLDFIMFSNGNIMVRAQAVTGELDFSVDNGVTFSAKKIWSDNGAYTPIIAVSGNTAIACPSSSFTNFTTTTDAGVTWSTISNQGNPADFPKAAYIASNYIFIGKQNGVIEYKTLANLTSPTTITATSNLTSDLLGFTSSPLTFVAYCANELSVVSTSGAPGIWTSKTTALFVTAGVSGNLVKILYFGGRFVAVTDTGDIAYSDDQCATWTLVDVADNPLSGTTITGLEHINGSFYVFGNTGKLAASTLGAAYVLLALTFSTTVRCMAGI